MTIKPFKVFTDVQKINKLNFLIFSPFAPLRSAIHGRGLFCKRNIDAGEMVIEYAGTVIRAVLTDKREKYYDSKVGYTQKSSSQSICFIF